MPQGSSELDVVLWPATPDDLPFIRQMAYQAAFGAEKSDVEPPPPFEEAVEMPWLKEYFEDWGREGDFGLIAVDELGKEVGAAWYRQYDEGRHVLPYELSMAVREEEPAQKAGWTLLKGLLKHARENGIPELGLQVGAENTAARKLYKKLGFLTIGGKDEYGNYAMAAATEGRLPGDVAAEELLGSRRGSEPHDPGAYFDQFAPLYKRYAEAGEIHDKVDHLIGAAIERKPSERLQTVLDLGAGTGMSINAILNHAQPSRIVAVDASSGMLEALRQSHEGLPIETVRAKVEDYVAKGGEKFDLISSIATFELIKDLPAVLRRITGLLNEGGVLAATYVPLAEGDERVNVTHSPYLRQKMVRYHWPEEEIERSITDSGLVIVRRDSSLPAYPLGDKWIHYNFVAAAKPVGA